MRVAPYHGGPRGSGNARVNNGSPQDLQPVKDGVLNVGRTSTSSFYLIDSKNEYFLFKIRYNRYSSFNGHKVKGGNAR
jgi:hypothetical protein